jgi:diguanylate cyclase (GGDEF)-like protein/PAS domain S-box-containing protein
MRLFRFCLLILLLCAGLISSSWGQEKPHVLLLNSYHYGLNWTDDETKGVRDILDTSALPVELHVEYMDSKRLNDDVHFKNLRQLLGYKYRGTRFSSILVTDNDAFNFLRQYRNDPIFAGVPVIFAGINFFHQDMLSGLHGFTGVAETFEAGQTVGVMQRLHPDVRRIVVIIDATTTGEAIRKEMTPMIAPYARRISFEFWDKLSLDQLRARLATLDKGTLVLLMPYARDNLGTFISYPDLAGMVSQASPVPVYGTYDFYMGHGIVGGRLTSGEAQGRALAKILQRVLGGENPNLIPVIRVAPSEFKFDSRQLHRYDIGRSQLPLESRILFQTWYETYQSRVWAGVLAALVIFFLGWGWIRSSRLERQSAAALKQSKEQLEAILNSTSESIFHVDENGRILAINEMGAHRIGQKPQAMIGGNVFDYFPPEVAAGRRESLFDVFQTGFEAHTEDRRADHHFSLNYYPIFDSRGKVSSVVLYAADITERKQAEVELGIAATAFELQEGILITDAECVIVRANCAFTAITGYTIHDVVGKKPKMLSSGRHDARFYDAMWQHIKEKGTWHGEIWNRRKNGEIYPQNLTITAVRSQQGLVTNYVAAFSDITEIKGAEEKIRSLAFYDSLTGLPNRRLLQDRLQQALLSVGRTGKQGALLFIDLDNFKILNDTLGHGFGDLLLQQVAQRLASCVRDGDTVARLGGDEFVVMLENLSQHAIEAAEQTEMIGSKILAMLGQTYQLNQHEFRSTASIGATLFIEHQSIETLLQQADIAMYEAKKAGRNTLRFFDPMMQELISERAEMESELRCALEKRQFQLYYQIQVDRENQPIGAEALLRWNHPERGLISPALFIPLAEDTGTILPVGLWILDAACAQLKIWQNQPLTRDLVLAVNVSARQFRQSDFVLQIQETVNRHGIRPSHLKIELTESVVLTNVDDTIAKMMDLKSFGVNFSMDDFGTGYSSLQYLKRLPLDQLKIDQSFVRDIATDSNDKSIVTTIIAMAHALNLDVIAEGVETEAQREFLELSGCRHFQGYLFSKPLPIEQFEALLAH